MFVRSYRIYLLLATLFSFYPIFGMDLPLCATEKKLFLCAIEHAANKIGFSLILKQLNLAQQAEEPIQITLKFYNADIDQDPLTKDIFETITFKDGAFGYIPRTIKKNGKTLPLSGKPTNYLGNYTRYWHRKDEQGPYIKCKSKFTNIALLQEALAEIEKK